MSTSAREKLPSSPTIIGNIVCKGVYPVYKSSTCEPFAGKLVTTPINLSLTGIYLILDEKGMIVFINEEGRRILGIKKGTGAGKNWIKTFIPKNALVIDIGAHVGEFNLFCSNYLEAKRIYSFEPYQKSYSLLQMNVEKNLTYNYAIYPKDEMILYISQKSTQLNSVIKENTEGSENSEKIKCVYLDKIVKELIKEKYFDLLKIDVEGSEYEVLKTAIETIKVTKYLLIEISINRESKLNFIDFFSYLISNFNFLKVVALNNYNIGNRAIDILFENIDWRGSK